jgi:hypothetical protein
MDPQTDLEFVLTEDHSRALRATWSAEEIRVALNLSELPEDARHLITPVA